jgi:citrate lyase subunit beta/citryl-CoA lyase
VGEQIMGDRLRRTMMFVPGNNPGMVKDAYIYKCDSIMFDLEDSVSLNEKDAARYLLYNSLRTIDYGEKELVVRINNPRTECGIMDIKAMVASKIDVIRLPKTETVEDIIICEKEIEKAEKEFGLEIGSTKMMAAIESALGVLNAKDIAFSSKRLIAIALGAEDYVTDLKTKRYKDGVELMFARSMILHAARAAKLDALDTVFSNLNDEEGFRDEVMLIKKLGFDGKSIINPRQIEPIIEIFTPTKEEIEKAMEVMEAIKEAERHKSGVISLNGKMIDRPIVLRAERVIALAKASKVLY